jgi:hypothetical protein
VSVSTEHGCTWSAASQTSWVVVTSGANGVGPGQATFSVASNGAAERTGTLIVAGRGVSVTQASGCTFKLDPETASFGIFGGNGSITVTPSGSGCPWTATPAQSWITIRSGASGNDVGLIVYSVNAFLGSRRTGTIMVGNRVFTVTQN